MSQAWETRRASDEDDIKSGTLPSDYVFAQDGLLKKSTLLSLVQTGTFDQVLAQLLSCLSLAFEYSSFPVYTLTLSSALPISLIHPLPGSPLQISDLLRVM